jgi:hypothetical protein
VNSEPTKILSRLRLLCKFTRVAVGYSFSLFEYDRGTDFVSFRFNRMNISSGGGHVWTEIPQT